MSASPRAGDNDGQVPNPPHHKFKRANKALLLKIGFTGEQSRRFAHETEQLCGAKMQLNRVPESSVAVLTLQNAARVHLFPRWRPLVRAGLQKDQEERFWKSWMSSNHRTFLKKYTAGRWTQLMQFPDPPADSISGPSSSLAPTMIGSAKEDSMASTENTASSHVLVTPAMTAVSTSTPDGILTPLELESRQGVPEISEQHTLSQRSSRVPIEVESEGSLVRCIASVLWGNVKLKINFTQMHTHGSWKTRDMNIPLIRCVDQEIPNVNEDSSVVPAWLDLRSVNMLIINHWHEQRGWNLGKRDFALCTKFHDVNCFKIRDSNDFHLAFNKWRAQRSAVDNVWWIFCVPPRMLDTDPESEPSDSENPFSNRPREG